MEKEKDFKNHDQEKAGPEVYPTKNPMHPVYEEQRWFIKTRNIIYYVLGVIEVLLLFRLLFRLLGASTRSAFVQILYSVTGSFIAPFRGIFRAVTADGGGVFVLEPDTIIAMIVYAVLVRGLVSLIKLQALNGAYK